MNNITTGAGNDVLSIYGGTNTISAKDGDNTIDVIFTDGATKITTGNGRDIVNIYETVASNYVNTISTGKGNDEITISRRHFI